MSDNRNGFERDLVNSFDFALGENGTAWRRREHKGASQDWDLTVAKKVVFSQHESPFMCAIEAKSKSVKKDTKSAKSIYFSQFFDKDGSTVEEELDKLKAFTEKTGFIPFIAVEGRKSTGSEAFIIPFKQVKEMVDNGEKAIVVDEEYLPEEAIKLERFHTNKREEGHPKYDIPDSFFKSLREEVKIW